MKMIIEVLNNLHKSLNTMQKLYSPKDAMYIHLVKKANEVRKEIKLLKGDKDENNR